jgi:hypothetical protein
MTYSPFSTDDSDLDEWIRQQAEASALDDLASPQPMAAMYQPPPHTEMAPLNFDTGPDWSDALGAGTTALAALADLGLNHGRGTGQILAAGGQFGQARAEQRLRGTQDALNYEQKRADLERSNRYTDLQYANLAARMQRQQGGGGAITPYQQSQLDAKKTTADRLEQERQDRLAAAKAADEDRDAAREDRGQQFQLSLEDRKAAREAAEAERADRAADRQQTQADRAQERADKEYQAESNTFRAKTEKTRPQVERMRQIDDILNKPQYADDIPGVGAGSYIPGWVPDALRGGEENANDARTMQMARADMTDFVARVRSGAVVPPPEYTKIASFVTAGEHATDEQFKTAYAAYHKMLSEEIRQQSSGREKAARDVLGPDTANYMLGPEYAPPPAAAADDGPLPPDRISGPVAGPPNLGVAAPPGVRNTPDFPGGRQRSGFGGSAAPQSPRVGAPPVRLGGGVSQANGAKPMPGGSVNMPGDDGVMMQSPSGNTGMVPPDKVAAALLAHWKRL